MMADEFQIIPLSSSKVNPRSDDEEFAGIKPKPPLPKRKTNKCLVYFLSGLVITAAVLLIFAQFVLRPSTPDAEINFVRVENLTYSNNNASSSSFSVTLWTEFKIKNKSFARFTYENSTAGVLYGATAVGEAELKGRRVGAKETNFVNVKVDLSSKNVNGGSGNRNLSSDLSSGVLNLSCYGEINGEMDTLKIFKKKRTATVDCNMNLDLVKRSIRDLFCN